MHPDVESKHPDACKNASEYFYTRNLLKTNLMRLVKQLSNVASVHITRSSNNSDKFTRILKVIDIELD